MGAAASASCCCEQQHAIKRQRVVTEPATAPFRRPVGATERRLPTGVEVCYLFAPGELEGGVRRATDPVWSLKTFTVERIMIKQDQPVMYWISRPEARGHDGPKCSFVPEELMVVPPDTVTPD